MERAKRQGLKVESCIVVRHLQRLNACSSIDGINSLKNVNINGDSNRSANNESKVKKIFYSVI